VNAIPATNGSAPFCRYFNIFGTETSQEIYRLALAKREAFSNSRTSPSKNYRNWRKSKVIYDDQLTSVFELVQQEIIRRLPEVLASLSVPRFEVDALELQLTSHNDGEYYHWHTDNGTPATAARTITFVYYFHAEPRVFQGGELVIYQGRGERHVITPQHDSMVFFPSTRRHEVLRVDCPTRRFEDGRFTLNGWIRRRIRNHVPDHFGYWIFAPPPRTGQAVKARVVARQRVSTVAAVAPSCSAEAAVPSTAADCHWHSLRPLYSALHRASHRAQQIDIRVGLAATEFFEDYYFSNRPVLLRDAMRDSPAVRSWSPEFFKRHYAQVQVQITSGRDSDPDYELHFRRSITTVPLGEYVERVLNGASNDVYIVARNYFFDNPALRHLRHDLRPPPGIVDATDERPGTVKLWFGPRSTVTPLHFDEHSILLAQIYGRKKFLFIPPFDTDKLYLRNSYYSEVDPERVDLARHPAFANASIAAVEVGPGDLLFIPVGWWHWARALELSMSATFCSFCVQSGNTALGGAAAT
jgi:Rps23 Pro-64 3,4-dihydroxylase Tpa1-like proline 4-hydroxylase